MLLFLMPLTLVAYFLILWFISHRSSQRGGQTNDAFFPGGPAVALVDGGIWHDWGEHFGGDLCVGAGLG